MRKVTNKNIRKVSAIFHGCLAAVVVMVLLSKFNHYFDFSVLLAWSTSVVLASYFGWKFGAWYVPTEDESWFIEHFFVTPVVTLLSAMGSGFILTLSSLTTSIAEYSNIVAVIASSVFIGFMVVFTVLPVLIFVGIIVPLYLYVFGGFEGTPED